MAVCNERFIWNTSLAIAGIGALVTIQFVIVAASFQLAGLFTAIFGKVNLTRSTLA